MQPLILAKRAWLLLFFAVIAFYFYGLGHIPFVGPDEPRYAEVAREMFLRRDLITPTLGGYAWFEKPPLLYWMMIASFRLFGISESSARLGPALCGLLTVAAVFWVGRRVCQSSTDQLSGLGAFSGIIAASTLGLIVFSRGVGFDIVVTMTVTWAMSCFLVSELAENEKARTKLLAGFYCFIGLSLLAKGLIGLVIPFGVVAAYQLLRREFPGRRLLSSLAWGVPLALAVAAIWYVPVIVRHGWRFIDDFFIQHHFARYLSNKYHHPQPFYFYFLIIIPLSLPWTAFLIDALTKTRKLPLRGDDSLAKQRAFALAWFFLPLVFFSFSASKLPGYILPVLPAAALITGEHLARYVSGRDNIGIWAMRATGALCGIFVLAGVAYARSSGKLSWACTLLIGAPVAAVAVICVCWARKRAIAALAVVFATFLALVLALNCGVRGFAEPESLRNPMQVAEARGYGATPVYALHEINRSVEFYAAGRVVYAASGNPVKLEGALEALAAAKQVNGPILVVVPIEYIYQLTQLEEAKADLLGTNGRVALVALEVRRE